LVVLPPLKPPEAPAWAHVTTLQMKVRAVDASVRARNQKQRSREAHERGSNPALIPMPSRPPRAASGPIIEMRMNRAAMRLVNPQHLRFFGPQQEHISPRAGRVKCWEYGE
jgi:hypothetical protein